MRRRSCIVSMVAILSMWGGFITGAEAAEAEKESFCFALLLWGARDDKGWSQAQYEAGKDIESTIPGTRMLCLEKVNPRDRPGLNIPELTDELVAKGAKLVIAGAEAMKEGIREAAQRNPDVCFVHIAIEETVTGKAGKNLSNLMLRVYQGHMLAGLAAALTTRSGAIGYLGPVIDAQGRRRVVAAYLGARYGWSNILGKNPKDLKFKVTWIGSWTYVPQVTRDPAEVVQDFYNAGYDVVISGIDTSEDVIVAARNRKKGKQVWGIPNNYKGACAVAPKACLGVPFVNWAPGYSVFIRAAMAGTCKHEWLWLGADWENFKDPERSPVGFLCGPSLAPGARKVLDEFARGIAAGKIHLFQGPLYYRDGTLFLKEGEVATDKQIWHMKQLLRGIEVQSK